MWTAGVVIALSIAWFGAHKMYEEQASWKNRRLRSSFAWAILGAIIGSFFGVAGLGDAIAGTIPGAIVGYILAGYIMKADRVDRGDDPAPIIEAISHSSPPITEFKTLSSDYSERVSFIRSQFSDGKIALMQGNHTCTLDLASAERLAEAQKMGGWAPTNVVREFERLQTWWFEPAGDDREKGSVPIFFSLMNTSERPVTGLILKFTNKGWVSSDLVADSYSVIAFAEELAPNARAIVATRMPLDLDWMVSRGGHGATGDIVRVWYA